MNLAVHSPHDAPASPAQAQVKAPAQVRVIVCDDSVAIRGAIVRMLETDPAIRVVARAANGRAAIDELARTPVDVLVLDVEMPVLDGLAALPSLLRADPDLRVIMASTLTTRGAGIAMRALRLGAADYVPKPSSIGLAGDETFRRELIEKVKGLARLRRRAVAANVDPPGLANAPRAGTATAGHVMTVLAAGRSRPPHCACKRPRRCPRGCWPSAVRPVARKRCSLSCKASAARCQYL